MHTVHHIAPTDILDDALIRDRTEIEEVALGELTVSIVEDGLRQPIEVFLRSDPGDGPRYGLIAGLRRLTVFRTLHANQPDRYPTIPAFVRQPADVAAAMAAMVAENELRAQITPWEKGTLLVASVQQQVFPTLDAACDALFPSLSRQARSRLRGYALVVETLEGALTDPRTIPSHRMDRLAAACRGGLGDLMCAILADHRHLSPETQWHALAPAIAEAILLPEDNARTSHTRDPRPRRELRLFSGVTLRRELTPTGWIIRINAKHARHPGIVDDILDYVERWFQRIE